MFLWMLVKYTCIRLFGRLIECGSVVGTLIIGLFRGALIRHRHSCLLYQKNDSQRFPECAARRFQSPSCPRIQSPSFIVHTHPPCYPKREWPFPPPPPLHFNRAQSIKHVSLSNIKNVFWVEILLNPLDSMCVFSYFWPFSLSISWIMGTPALREYTSMSHSALKMFVVFILKTSLWSHVCDWNWWGAMNQVNKLSLIIIH